MAGESFVIGDAVVVAEGLFEGWDGVVVDILGEGRIVVDIRMGDIDRRLEVGSAHQLRRRDATE